MAKEVQTIRDFSGKIVGYIETDSQGNKIVRDFYRVILGKYDKKNNVTRDFYGKIIARGDASASLIRF
jgi:uncharacterized protein YvpB